MSKVKIISDVNFSEIIKQISTAAAAANTLIAVPSAEDVESFKTYSSLDEVTEDFNEETTAYKEAEKYFETLTAANVYTETIAIGTYSTKDLPDPMAGLSEVAPTDVKAGATGDGADVTADDASTATVPGVVHMLTNYFNQGWRYIILPESDVTTTEAVMDFVYENQHGILIARPSDVTTTTTLKNYATKFTDNNKMLPVFVIPDKEDQPVEAGVAATATVTVPVDWQHIGKLPEIVANDWTAPEFSQFDGLNAAPVVNKSGDMMLLHGRALDGHYMDNVFGMQYIHDYLVSGMQHWLDMAAQRHLKYNDAGLALVKTQLQLLLSNLSEFFAEDDAGKPACKVTVPTRNQVATATVEKRKVNVTVDYTMANLIDYIDGQINLTI